MTDLEDRKRYDPAEAEPRILRRWLDAGINHPEPGGSPAETFSIAVPPPNVTGALHMGHALNGSIQDVLIRFNRMRGKQAKWVFGTDHAGIATQKQVEQRLAREGVTKEELGRERFVEEVWKWTREHGGIIQEQFKRLGASLDFDDERFTLDDRYVEAVLKVFVDLYEKGLIYRDHYMVNWDPGLGTAVSDLEVEEREVTDTLYSIRYSDEIVVATVRPETMLGDTAVAVHPDDPRYQHLIGTRVTLPLVGRRLPVIADEYVKTDFGTGALKITPGHDANDFEIGRRHDLDTVSVIGEDGRMSDEAGERFAGMTALEARESVVAALGGAVVATEPYTHNVPYSHRSGARIEPLISLQWFMHMNELARPAIEVVQRGELKIHPESQARRYVEWLENIRPWCISRQLWWGHQIPVWYRGEEERYVGVDPPDGDGWTRDPDVLDTWFSSGLWPFATLGWPEETADVQAFYPTDVLSTARDILFLWVARMVMLGLEFPGKIPFQHVYVHSVIQAPDGRRMSKSLGTGIDPVELIDRYGADAVRFGLLAMSSTQDVRFSEEKVGQGAQLANKLFNASRLILMNAPANVEPAPQPERMEDRWILSRLQRAKDDAAARVDEFDFAKLALGLYDFVFGELCDWYLEFVKPRLYDGDEAAQATVLHVLRETLALAHPVIPFVTEEINSLRWGTLLAAEPMPASDSSLIDGPAELAVENAIAVTRALRTWRESVEVKPKIEVRARLKAGEVDEVHDLIARMARFAWITDGGPPVATVPVGRGVVEIVETEGLDLAAAGRKREAERTRLEGEIKRVEGKLANEKFVAKAPPHLVEEERAKLQRFQTELAAL